MDERVKPRLRGVSHMLAFVAALVGCLRLARVPVEGAQSVANLVFGGSLVLMFGVSGSYHWPTWSAATYRRLQRLDHASIYILIAGSFTPLATLAPMGGWSQRLLWVMWGAALTGAALTLLGISASRGLRSALYVALGCVAAPVMLNLPGVMGASRVGWLFFGAVLYAVGAVVYARRWPDPAPAVFGYHEVFHAMVVAAAATHYAVLMDFVGG
ncbi:MULTISPECIES: hemolysin III family protein [Corallococcus]|uniref:PAQR family membrane homeostasis protein TrhA n=1 Tax=Corallococcus TaxID=83461 RepID=UPI0011815758|nr:MULTISPECIES: hemolysin III family protein [Corallococcus]NBD10834.1 hemolysin III [Corallococcus silvisoli]TSC31721.1 hemolysin III [Corallococcus sp. Z5C101001]